MPVLADYQQVQAPGANARAFLGAYEGVSSLMERKQRLAMAQEQQDMERQKFEAFKPAIIAKAQADLTSAAASIANATRMEQLRGKAAASSADYNDRFQEYLTIPDDKGRSDTLGAFMGEISWLDNPALPEYQGFAKAVREERAKAFTQATTNIKLDEHLQALSDAADARIEVAKIAAGAKTANAQTYSGSRERIAAINADTKLGVEDKKAAKQGIQLADLQERASQAEQDAADAERDGNPKLAQSYRVAAANFRDAIQHTTTFSGYAPTAPKPKSEDPTPSPKARPEDQFPKITFPGQKADSAQPTAAPVAKLYAVDPATKTPALSPSVKTPQDILKAVQQMVDDGVIDPATARETLTKLGFKKK